MIRAVAGFIAKEMGIISATVVEGPMPGRTPTTVPKKHPMKADRRFGTVSA